jgi:3-dehydroquinate synthase
LLNLGHTFAHALEAISGYDEALLHGEAVALGMVLAFELSVRLGLCPREDARRVRSHLAAVGLPTSRRLIRGVAFSTPVMLAAMGHDKKAQGGYPRFVLTRGIGHAFAGAEVESAELEALLDAVA